MRPALRRYLRISRPEDQAMPSLRLVDIRRTLADAQSLTENLRLGAAGPIKQRPEQCISTAG